MNWCIISVYLHILAAVIWLCGMLLLVMVLIPIASKLQSPGTRVQMLGAVGRRFLPIA
jgi:uncharacterized membrane protein